MPSRGGGIFNLVDMAGSGKSSAYGNGMCVEFAVFSVLGAHVSRLFCLQYDHAFQYVGSWSLHLDVMPHGVSAFRVRTIFLCGNLLPDICAGMLNTYLTGWRTATSLLVNFKNEVIWLVSVSQAVNH